MITAPYNFVPLANKVYFPDWADNVSQDIPFGDGEDGVIELTIKNITPLFTKNGSKKTEKVELSSHVVQEDGRKRYFIPGTTLKGCFRSVMEILSFAKMQMYNNDSFGIPREFDTRKPDNKYYMQFMKDIRCGWLQKIGEEYFIKECVDGIVDIKHTEIKSVYSQFYIGKDHASAELKQRSFGAVLYPDFTKDGNEYQIVCTGYMNGKQREYLFSKNQYPSVEVDRDVVQTFESVHRNTEYYGGKNGKGGFLKTRLHKGEPIPVFFTSVQGKVTAMGITRMFRYPYPINVKTAVDNNYSSKIDYSSRDLPEIIFGYVNGQDALKGRVSFTPAFADNMIDDKSLVRLSGVLGQPSSSYYPLYLKHDGTSYTTFKDANACIAGRKRYRITKNGEYFDLQAGNGNDNVQTTLLALPSNQTFRSRIVFHNLRSVEIGALISALTMNGAEGVLHNIGMAKSFGLGQIKCEIALKGLKKTQSDYLRDFEFELASAGFNISEETSLKRLIAIASPTHSREDMEFMDLKKYRSEKTQFSSLKELPAMIHTEMSSKKLFEAKKVKQEALEKAKREKEEQEIAIIQRRIAEAEELEAKRKAEEAAAAKARTENKYSISFAEMLVMDEYLVTNLLKWIKIEGHVIGDSEYTLFVNYLKSMDKNARKKVMNKRQDLAKALGKSYSDKLYKEKELR